MDDKQRACEFAGWQWRHGRCVYRVDDAPKDQPVEDEARTPMLTMEQAAGLATVLTDAGIAYLVVVREPGHRGFAERPEVRTPEEFVRHLLTLGEGP